MSFLINDVLSGYINIHHSNITNIKVMQFSYQFQRIFNSKYQDVQRERQTETLTFSLLLTQDFKEHRRASLSKFIKVL
jgi:hypothetical protein